MTANQTRDKMRAVFLAALMVFSVFGGTIAFAGTAAANVESLSMAGNSEVVNSGDTIWVSGTASNTDDVTLTLTENSDSSSAEVTKSIDSEDFSVSIDLSTLSWSGGDGELSDGETVTVEAIQDSSDTAATTQFEVDDTTPTISSYSVTNPSGQDVKVSFDSSEELASIEVDISGPDGTTLTKSDFDWDGSTYTATYTASEDGSYTATLNTASDGANDGSSSEEGTVSFDVGPSFNNESPKNEIVTDNQTAVSVDISDSDIVNHHSIEVTISNSESVTYSTSDDGVSFDGKTLTVDPTGSDVEDLPEGNVDVTVYAEDGNGYGDTTSFSFKVDSTGPEITVDSPADGDFVNSKTETITASITDAESDVNPMSVSVTLKDSDGNLLVEDATDSDDGVHYETGTLTVSPGTGVVPELPEDEITVVISATDTEGNSNTAMSSFTVDLTEPKVTGVTVEDAPIGNDDLSESTDKEVTINFDEPVKDDGSMSVDVTLNDGTSIPVTVESDQGFNSDKTSWNATLDLSGLSVEDTATVSVSGVQDRATNSLNSSYTTGTFEIDTVAPSVSTSLDSTPVNDTVNVTEMFTVSDGNLTGVTYEYQVGSSGDWQSIDSPESFDTTALDEGEITIKATAEDKTGNTNTASGVAIVDNVEPAIDSNLVEGQLVYGELNLTEEFDLTDAETVTYRYNSSNMDSFDDVENSDAYADGVLNTEHDSIEDGTLGLEVTVTDANGTSVMETVNVTVNNLDVSNYEANGLAGDDAGMANVTFQTETELDSVRILVTNEDSYFEDAESFNVTLDDFQNPEYNSTTGEYTYTAEFDVPRDGAYNADLVSASATDGQKLVDSAKDDPFKVDGEDPHVIDAQIEDVVMMDIDSDADDEVVTKVHVEFNERVQSNIGSVDLTTADALGLEDDRASVTDFTVHDNGTATVYFDSTFQTGDEPNLTAGDDAFLETHSVETRNGTSADDTTTVHTLELNLEEGHNVVSVPAASGTVDLSELDALTENDTVWAYDDGEWLHYTPGDNQSTLESLEGGQGYIFVMDSAADVDLNVYNQPGSVSGDLASSSPGSEDVNEGWNLLGHWQEGSQSVSDGLSTIGDGDYGAVYEQTENGELSFTVASDLEPGEGYWVFVTEDDGDVYGEHAWATS